MEKFISWVLQASEFDSPKAVVGYLTIFGVFVVGLVLYVASLGTSALAWMGVVGVVLMWPYILGLTWRVRKFHAAKGSWLALLSALI